MMSQKSHSLKLFLWKNFFTLTAAFFATFLSINFYSNEASALFVPTLSASVDQANLQVNGNQVINGTNKTTEIPLNLTVNTNNKTGYTATLNSETDETALVNNDSSNGAKINSISANLSLNNLPNNTWGYKFGASTNYAPIPALSAPAQILKTTGKTNGNETNNLKLGMKLGETLESGSYKNKLIFSILTNNYNRIAIMTEGPDFNTKLKSLGTTTNKIEHFKKSTVAPAASMNTKNIEDEESDYEIKLWLNPTDKTAYYYAETEKVYLNRNSGEMFRIKYNERKTIDILDMDLSNFDTSQVTNMYGMFSGMYSLTTLDLSNFNTSRVIYMSYMFSEMYNLTTLDLSSFNTSNVTDMDYMFFCMRKITTLDLSSFNTSKVTNMHDMFNEMNNLTSLNLSNFDTSKVKRMDRMFCYVSSLTTLNLSSFNTSNVEIMGSMFYGMKNLTTLDLSNFDTSKVTDMSYMFYLYDDDISKDKLETIYVNNDFNTAKLTDFTKMFKNRRKLRGGAGSYLADPSTADKSWLRIDDPAHGRPGYFTRKP